MGDTGTSHVVVMRRALDIPLPAIASPPGITLAPLAKPDAPAIHAVLQRAYANGYGSVQPDWHDWWEWMIADEEFDQKLCVVAKADAEVAGFCLCWNSSFIKDLVVDPAFQGRGIGATLLTKALVELAAVGMPRVRLKVDARNTGARRFYERMGFVVA